MKSIKKCLVVLLTGIILIVVGCANKEYDDAMEKGKDAIRDNNYAEAISCFEKAKNEKANDEKANSYLIQTELMESGLINFNQRKFDEASDDFNEIVAMVDEHLILKEDAENQLAEIDKKKELIEKLNDSYEKAVELKDAGDYEGALNLIEEELNKDLSHDSLAENKEELEDLKKEVNNVNTAYDEVKELLKEEKYKEGMDLVDETMDQNEVYGEKMYEFDKLYAELQSNIPSPDPNDINKHEDEYIYLGGVIVQVLKDENDAPEGLMFGAYKDPNPAKYSQSTGNSSLNHVSINISDEEITDKLDGVESNDVIYFYGYVEGDYTYENTFGNERSVKEISLEKIDTVKRMEKGSKNK